MNTFTRMALNKRVPAYSNKFSGGYIAPFFLVHPELFATPTLDTFLMCGGQVERGVSDIFIDGVQLSRCPMSLEWYEE